uniref:Uncharacterized protein n=1 Tax=Arundo donax TaxID=35708 RepID=A0A0A9CT48_ARUDO
MYNKFVPCASLGRIWPSMEASEFRNLLESIANNSLHSIQLKQMTLTARNSSQNHSCQRVVVSIATDGSMQFTRIGAFFLTS